MQAVAIVNIITIVILIQYLQTNWLWLLGLDLACDARLSAGVPSHEAALPSPFSPTGSIGQLPSSMGLHLCLSRLPHMSHPHV